MPAEEQAGFGMFGAPVDRFITNAATGAIKGLTSLPAAAVDAVTHAAWTPRQAQQQAIDSVQGGQVLPVGNLPPITPAMWSDYAAEKTGQLGDMAILGGAAKAVGGKIAGYANAQSLPPLVAPIEATAREAGGAIPVPNPGRFEDNIALVGPDIKRFARESGYPIGQKSTIFHDPHLAWNVSKIADQYASNLSDHYGKLVDAAQRYGPVNIAGSSDPFTPVSVEALDSTAKALNTKVDAAYSLMARDPNAGRIALQQLRDDGTLGEQKRIGNLLNDTLAKRNGLDPKQISAFRQHIAASRDIATQTDMADSSMASNVGQRSRGTNPANVRTSSSEGIGGFAIRKTGELFKGNERAAGAHAFTKALQKLPEANTPLPSVGGTPAPEYLDQYNQFQGSPTPFTSATMRPSQPTLPRPSLPALSASTLPRLGAGQ
jgi:hypothetical protein